MSKVAKCFDGSSEEWKLLVKDHDGDIDKAFDEYESNNYKVPQRILDLKASNAAALQEFPSTDTDPYLEEKSKILEKALNSLNKKVKRLSNQALKHPHVKESRDSLREAYNKMLESETDFALHTFMMEAYRLTGLAQNEINKLKQDSSKLTLSRLKFIREQTQFVDVLKELREDYFNKPEHKQDFIVVEKILSSQNKIRQDFLDLSKDLISDQWGPYFEKKLQSWYRRKGEQRFQESKYRDLKDSGVSKKDIEVAKEDYIDNYMLAHSEAIELEAKRHVRNTLSQTVDIPQVVSWFVNPKDMGHDIMAMAVESLDNVDWEVMQATRHRTYQVERLQKEFIKYIGKSKDPKDQYSSLLAKDGEGKILPVLINKHSSNWKEFVSKYQNTPVWDMYSFINDLVREKDSFVPKNQRLGYILPKINKNFIERTLTQGKLKTGKETIIDLFKVRGEDIEFGQVSLEDRAVQAEESNVIEVITNEAGRERERVPLFYRGKVDKSEQSYDIVSMLLLDYHNSLQFKTKTETGMFLEVLKDVVSEASIKQRTDFKKLFKVDKHSGQQVEVSAANSNLEKSLQELIRHRIYGINVEGDPKVAKALTSMKGYTSALGLSFNYLSGAANLVHGTALSWIETAGGKKGYYTKKDRAKASIKYDKDLVNIVGDAASQRRLPKSKTNLLMELLNASSDYHAVDKRFMDNNAFRKHFRTGTLHSLNAMGEHAVQSVVMYSILNNIKVQNEQGEFLDKNYKPTSNREDALSLDEAISFDESGEFKVDPRVFKTEKTSGISHDDLFKVSRIIRRVNRDLYGNYDQQNKSQIRRHAVGALFMQMRGWLVPSLQKRYRGIGTALKDPSKLNMDQVTYSFETGNFEEGQYVTAIRFLNSIKKELLFLKVQSIGKNWERLTDQEKGNVRKTSIELAVAIMALSMAMGLGNDEDDPVFATYLSRRLYSELTTFILPQEIIRTARNPMMLLGTMKDVLDTFTQGMEDLTYHLPFEGELEKYAGGRHRGEARLKKKFLKLIPGLKQFNRNTQEALLFLERN